MLPEAFLERMKRILGGEYEAFLETYEQEPYHALRWNPLKIGADGRSAAEKRMPGLTEKVPWAEYGYYYGADVQPGKHPFHEAGLYYIQEPSAMYPAELLGVRPGEKVLDLCAAPGGKSTQIAAKLQGRGILVCNEIHPARAKILSENIERMGIGNACVVNEPPERLETFFPEYFDRILVDAPCSGEGMFRRNEEARAQWSPENVALCAQRQDKILDCAAVMLRPGGKLVYSTCTFAPEENEESVSRFLERHREFAKLGSRQLFPHLIKGEGHFAAELQKEDSKFPDCVNGSKEAGAKGIPIKELKELASFCRECLCLRQKDILQGLGGAAGMEQEVRCIRFGDNLYLVPALMPSLKGIKVLRPGLHLGAMKKNRFEPSHALALALAPEYAARTWNLDSGQPAIAAYLGGGTFPAEGERGWHLICVDGFGTGWGKLAGGIMKNHYPKGLRK